MYPDPVGSAQAVYLTLAAAGEQAATDDEGLTGRLIRLGRDGVTVPIDRAADRGGRPLMMDRRPRRDRGVPRAARRRRCDEVGSQQFKLMLPPTDADRRRHTPQTPRQVSPPTDRLPQVGGPGYRYISHGETEPGADERRKRE